ncbi:MAG: hypothetical protein ACD_63C00010G0002 [uncultured bacterium]|nr:MAG: hypothetical protein ACD_63C00010G0002 [uncultured bacterium]
MKKVKRDFKSDFSNLEKKFEEYKKLAKENLEGWQRAKADYENLKKRSAKEFEETVKAANEQLIVDLLPVVDNFNNALKHVPEDQKEGDWIKGILFIKRQMEDILTSQNVVPIESVGKKFDPKLHEAVGRAKGKSEKSKKEKIVEEIQRGYMLNGKVVRAAKVKVS